MNAKEIIELVSGNLRQTKTPATWRRQAMLSR